MAWSWGKLVHGLLRMGEAERWAAIRKLPYEQKRELLEEWRGWAHRGQIEPPGGEWRVWLIRAGRGFGKTRAGAEWVAERARSTPDARIALVGQTVDEVRRVMVEGESGLLATARAEDGCAWTRTTGEVRWASGARAAVYSAENPEGLRGPQHHAAWCDELAKWSNGDATWDNLMLGLRCGDRPRVVVTTTPRPNALMRRVMAMAGTEETRGRTRDNLHLPPAYLETVEGMYGGTRLGRQELEGELIEDVDGALWSRALLDQALVDAVPELARVVVGVDPPASKGGDACGIVAVGLGADGRGYVLEDATVAGVSPEGWASAVAACAERWGADRVVAEKNQGGDMVEHVLRTAERRLPVKLVHASRGKAVRAEPVLFCYQRGEVAHLRGLAELEDQLCGLRAAGGYEGPGRSPDRADACVWALWALLLDKPARVGVKLL